MVTGGAGFIGSHLVEALLHDHAVTVIDDFSAGRLSNLASIQSHENLTIAKGDIRNFSFVKDTLRKSDLVFHLAARVSVPFSVQKPRDANDVNVSGTLNLLEASVGNKVKKFIYSSSCSVYGEVGASPQKEDMLPQPSSPYGVSKLAAETYCTAFYNSYGLQTVSLRYFNAYGPRQRLGPYGGVITSFFKRVMEGNPPIIFGDGHQTRDFTFVSDVVNANLLASKRDAEGQVFNIGTGRQTSIRTLAQVISVICGKPKLATLMKPAREGDIRHSCADIRKAKQLLGYEPLVNLEDGLTQVVTWMRSGSVGRA